MAWWMLLLPVAITCSVTAAVLGSRLPPSRPRRRLHRLPLLWWEVAGDEVNLVIRKGSWLERLADAVPLVSAALVRWWPVPHHMAYKDETGAEARGEMTDADD